MGEGGKQRQKRHVRSWHRFGHVFPVPVTPEESCLDCGLEGSSLAKGYRRTGWEKSREHQQKAPLWLQHHLPLVTGRPAPLNAPRGFDNLVWSISIVQRTEQVQLPQKREETGITMPTPPQSCARAPCFRGVR